VEKARTLSPLLIAVFIDIGFWLFRFANESFHTRSMRRVVGQLRSNPQLKISSGCKRISNDSYENRGRKPSWNVFIIWFSPRGQEEATRNKLRLHQAFGFFPPVLRTVKHSNYCDGLVLNPIEDEPAVEWRRQTKSECPSAVHLESRFGTGLGKSS
jgi:hypothetical protein